MLAERSHDQQADPENLSAVNFVQLLSDGNRIDVKNSM